MPNGTQENKRENMPQPSPEERFTDLVNQVDTSEEVDALTDAFRAGKEGKHEDWAKLATAASQTGDFELLEKINKAFEAGKETGPTKVEENSERPEGEKAEVLEKVGKTLEGLTGLSKEEVKAVLKILVELSPELYKEIEKSGRIEVKTVVATFVGRFLEKIDDLPETMFTGLRALKKERPEEFKKFKEDFQAALLIDDEGERNRKVDSVCKENKIAGEVVDEVKKLFTLAAALREMVEGKTLTEKDKAKAKEMQEAGLRAAGGLWEKIWPIGGLFLSLMLIGLILTVILALSFSDYVSGKKK